VNEQPSIAVDFDDTISTPGAVYPDLGPPQDGVKEALAALHEMGCRVRIHSCRCNGQSLARGMLPIELQRIVMYMQANGLYFDDVVLPEEGKPFASYYVDNKGIRFQGNWGEVVAIIQQGLAKRVAREKETGYEVIADRIASSFSTKE
jgi:hypothetical protein